MELFRFGSTSSEDLLVKDRMNSPQAFYGGVWKFSKDKTKEQLEKTKAIITAQKLAEQNSTFNMGQQLDNALVTEAKEKGLIPDHKNPVVPPPLDPTVDHDLETLTNDEPVTLNREYLEKLTYPEIQTMAAAAGISNITLKKLVLIDKILEVQPR